jgi:hypothetical protein
VLFRGRVYVVVSGLGAAGFAVNKSFLCMTNDMKFQDAGLGDKDD